MVAAMVALAITGSLAYACVQNNGTTVGCAGTGNYIIVCALWPPSVQICTGTSAGSTYTDATGGNATGLMDASPGVGGCSATTTLAAGCCGGAVTSESVFGFYGYAYASGYTCP